MIYIVLNKLFKHRIISGIVLIIFSYSGFLIEPQNHTLITSGALGVIYSVGFMMLGDGLTMRFANISIFKLVYQKAGPLCGLYKRQNLVFQHFHFTFHRIFKRHKLGSQVTVKPHAFPNIGHWTTRLGSKLIVELLNTEHY